MAAIIHQTDKRSGITYAYESISYWDKEKNTSVLVFKNNYYLILQRLKIA